MPFRDFKIRNPAPHSACPFPIMPAPISPTYTSYSVPSPFSSDSSNSFPTRSPVSEPFDSMSDPEHHASEHTVLANDHNVGYSSSLPIYSEMPYISSQDFEYNILNWSAPDVAMPKRQQPVPHHYQHQQQPQFNQHVSAHTMPNDMERIKSMYISPNTSSNYQQPHRSPTIHSPVPIVPSHIPSHTSQPQQSQSPPRIVHPMQQPPIANETLFGVDIDEWQPSAPPPSHHTQFASTYPHYAQPELRRATSDFTGSFRVKQEDTFSPLGTFVPQNHSPRQAHIFDLSAHQHPQSQSQSQSQQPQQQQQHSHHQQHSHSSQSPHTQASSLSPPYYHRPASLQIQQQQQQAPQFAMHPAEPSPSSLSDACVRYDGYGGAGEYTHAHEQQGQTQYAAYPAYVGSADSGYADVCDPRFVSGKDGEWRGGAEAMFVDTHEGGDGEGEGEASGDGDEEDMDAEGDDDMDGYASSAGAYPPQYHQQQAQEHARGESPGMQRRHETDEEDDGETGESEEDVDDARDPEFVLQRRPRRHTYTATSPVYPYAEGRSLRSTRYNPYPPSPTAGFDFPQGLRARRSYSHTSTSPSDAEPSADGAAAAGVRRRVRPTSTLPVPVPVPGVMKKSRGRRVPTMEDFQDVVVPKTAAKKKVLGVGPGKGTRTYTCEVDGCGKLFARGEHLKRHVRSIHTYEKRELPPSLPELL